MFKDRSAQYWIHGFLRVCLSNCEVLGVPPVTSLTLSPHGYPPRNSPSRGLCPGVPGVEMIRQLRSSRKYIALDWQGWATTPREITEEGYLIKPPLPSRRRQWHPHSSTLAWKIPWTEEPGGLQSMGSLRVGHDWATSLWLFTFMHWRRKWQPTPVFLPGESQGWGSLVGCHLWGCTESDTTEATQQQQQPLPSTSWGVCAQSVSHVWLFVNPRTVALQAPLSMGFPRQEYWNGLPFPPPGDLPDPGIKSASLMSPATPGKPIFWGRWPKQGGRGLMHKVGCGWGTQRRAQWKTLRWDFLGP